MMRRVFGGNMTPQQQVALAFPCRDVAECASQRYRRLYDIDGTIYSVLLTLEIDLDEPPVFEEPEPVWHCSVAIISERQPKPLFLWSEEEMNVVYGLIYESLGGVRDEDRKHWEEGEVAVHFRRPVREEELELVLDPERN